MKGGELCPVQLQTADGLRSEGRHKCHCQEGDQCGRVGVCWMRGNVGGAREATALAENIVTFIFKAGDKVPPLTEKKGGEGGELVVGSSGLQEN